MSAAARRLPGLAFVLATLALAAVAAPRAPAATSTALDDYIRLQTGSFTTAQQAKLDARYETAIWHIAEIWPGSGKNLRWIYSESWMKDGTAPYMQRVSRIEQQADGSLLAQRFSIAQPERVVGAWQDGAKFAQLKPADLAVMAGCEVVLTRTGPERFEGGTVGSRCSNSYKGSAYAVSQGTITAQGMTNWDRGFAASGAQTWGPLYGGYQFRRLDAPAACIDPVRMLVYGEITDRKAFAAYGRALGQSGLYQKNGGYYEASSPAIEVFEGAPPPGRGVIIAQFPCVEAARNFWNSPEYAEIRKLRDGLASFEVLVMPAAQKPKYLAQ